MIGSRREASRSSVYLGIVLAIASISWLACGGTVPDEPANTATPAQEMAAQETQIPLELPTATARPNETPSPRPTDTPHSPTATPEPTAWPTLVSFPADPATISDCVNWPQPGLLFHDPLESPPLTTSYLVVDPYSGLPCRLVVSPYPRGEIVSAADAIFYAVYDPELGDLTIWRRFQGDSAEPLTFTSTTFDGLTPISFAVSDDGQHVAWSRVTPDPGGSTARLEMWSAVMDGSELNTLVDQQLNLNQDGMRFLEPLRFSADREFLYYGYSPIGLGGAWSSFYGRYDNLYRVALIGGEPEQIFDCQTVGRFLCLGDFSEEAALLAYVDNLEHVVKVADWSGEMIAVLEPPGADYVGYPVFGPEGELAFVSADLDELAPRPGFISLVSPPYTEAPRTILRDNTVSILWQWLDQEHLLFEYLADQNVGTGLVETTGLIVGAWPFPNYLQGVIR